MNKIVTYIALFGLLLALACAAPAKKSENTEQVPETHETQDPKQTSQETTEELTENTKETSADPISKFKPSNQEVTRYQDIEVDNDSKVTTENQVDKRSRSKSQVFPQKVAEHILTQNEAITLVTELTDEDYVEEFIKNEGAEGLFEALDLLRNQGWITDIEYTIISDSIYQLMLGPAKVPYDIEYESSYPVQETEQLQQNAQPIYTTNTLSSYQESEEQLDTRVASIVSGLLDRIAENDMTAEEGAEIISTLVKFLYGIEQTEEAADYSDLSEWLAPEKFYPLEDDTENFQLPNNGYMQKYDIVNSQGEPIGQAEEAINNYKTDDGELGQELAALEKVAGKYGDNGLFQGQQQVYEKEAFIPLSPMMGEEDSEELGSGSSEEETNVVNQWRNQEIEGYPWQKFLDVKG